MFLKNLTLVGQVRNPPTTLHQLEKTLQECQEVREWTRTFVQRVTESHRKETGERSFQQSRFIPKPNPQQRTVGKMPVDGVLLLLLLRRRLHQSLH